MWMGPQTNRIHFSQICRLLIVGISPRKFNISRRLFNFFNFCLNRGKKSYSRKFTFKRINTRKFQCEFWAHFFAFRAIPQVRPAVQRQAVVTSPQRPALAERRMRTRRRMTGTCWVKARTNSTNPSRTWRRLHGGRTHYLSHPHPCIHGKR